MQNLHHHHRYRGARPGSPGYVWTWLTQGLVPMPISGTIAGLNSLCHKTLSLEVFVSPALPSVYLPFSRRSSFWSTIRPRIQPASTEIQDPSCGWAPWCGSSVVAIWLSSHGLLFWLSCHWWRRRLGRLLVMRHRKTLGCGRHKWPVNWTVFEGLYTKQRLRRRHEAPRAARLPLQKTVLSGVPRGASLTERLLTGSGRRRGYPMKCAVKEKRCSMAFRSNCLLGNGYTAHCL